MLSEDAFVRFLYSRLGLNVWFFWSKYASDYVSLDTCFETMKEEVCSSGFDFKGKICLELGPGNSMINAYNFLMNGAKKVIMVDKYSRFFKTKKQEKYHRQELDFARKKYSAKGLFFLEGDSIRKEFIDWFPSELTEVDMAQRPDFIYSIDVLEHIRSIRENIKRMGDLLGKGTVMYHKVNLRDHYDPNRPFLFLKYPKNIWEKFLVKEGVSYTNRVRYSQIKEMFKENNFEIILEDLTRFPLTGTVLSKDFDKEDKDLDVGVCKVLCRKK